MALDAILFDLDDTLVSELDFVRSGYDAVAVHLCTHYDVEPEWATAMFEAAFAKDRAGVFDRVGADLGLTDDAVARCIAIYREHIPAIELLPDAVTALAWARAAGIRTGIVSDGLPVTQWRKIDALGLADLVDVVVLTGELPEGSAKPSAAGFEVALGKLGVAADRSVYVADNCAKDFVGPRLLGMHTVQVRRDNGIYVDAVTAEGGEPDIVIDSLEELERALG